VSLSRRELLAVVAVPVLTWPAFVTPRPGREEHEELRLPPDFPEFTLTGFEGDWERGADWRTGYGVLYVADGPTLRFPLSLELIDPEAGVIYADRIAAYLARRGLL
jgi:hypothetical protein